MPYEPVLILSVIGELLLLSFTVTAFGVMMAARITQIQAFMALTQMLIMPLFFLSSALYPLRALPAWLTVLTLGSTRLPARFTRCSGGPPPREHLARGEGGAVPGRHMERAGGPVGVRLGIAAVMGGAMLGKAIAEFRRTE